MSDSACWPHRLTQAGPRTVPAPVEPPSFESETEDALNRALRSLALEKQKTGALTRAVERAIRDGISALGSFPQIPAPKPDTRKKAPEVAVAVVSDLQLAKITPTYNTAICEERMVRYADKIIKLAEIQRADHPVPELRVWLLGDIVEGEMIFPGQAHLIDASLYRQVTIDGPRILGNFLRKLLPHFETVKVVGVIGNHGSLGGRARREYNPETNADRMLYRILRLMFEGEKRITWEIPEGDGERKWYAVERIGKRGFLLCHGDQFRWGIKSPSAEQKILGWRTGGVPEPFDEVVCGHWHNINRISLKGGSTTLRCNGSTESSNSYAQEFVGSMSEPMQWVFFCHAEQGVSAEYAVNLK